MVQIPIDDPNDPRIAIYRNLKPTNETRWSHQFVVEGNKLTGHLAESRHPLVSIFCVESRLDELPCRLPDELPVYYAAKALISEVAGFNFHLGMLACATRNPISPDQFWSNLTSKPVSTLVVCPELHNPDNLGALARIGDAFHIDGILTGIRCPDPFLRRVSRVSMGASLRLPILVSPTLSEDLQRLKREWRFELAATVVDPNAEPLTSVTRSDRFALLFGTEADGLAPCWLDHCSRRITIPMRTGADSLNIAVAAGIFLHHFRA